MAKAFCFGIAGLLIALCCLGTVSAHLCMVNPHQRGSMTDLNKAGSNDCILLKAPCGGRRIDPAQFVVLKGGTNYTVIFQKNLDHWAQATPGYFSISFSGDNGATFKEAARIEDMGEPSLHLYSVQVTLPAMSTQHRTQILQVVYMTKNSAAPPAFYQCADIALY